MPQTHEGAMLATARKRGLTLKEFIEKSKTHKWCNIGLHWQLKTLFHGDKSRYDGLCHKCTECRKSKDPYAALRGRVSTFKGKKHTDEAKEKLRNACLKRKNDGTYTPPMFGKNLTLDARKKISEALRERGAKGERCHSYKDGKLAERRGQRFSKEYKRWRFDVFSRDGFTCQKCGDDKGGNLNAHHIKPFADFPELRFDIDNGITLCQKCHDAEHYKMDE